MSRDLPPVLPLGLIQAPLAAITGGVSRPNYHRRKVVP